MKKYELLFILKSTTSEEERKNLIERFKNFLTSEKAENVKVDVWGMKKFAYPIDYKTEGFYVLVDFESAPEVPNKLGAQMRITEDVVRYMFTTKE